jgi:hypothetical protein
MLQIMAINESPVFLLLNPTVDLSRKDLPVALYETGTARSRDLKAVQMCVACVCMYMSV